jgi:hypothetical protein
MSQHDFQFFENVIFSFKEWSIILFSYLFSHLCEISNQKKTYSDMCIWMFSIMLSHFEIITWFFVYDSAFDHFLVKKNYI